MAKIQKVGRSAESGRFVTVPTTKRTPSSTFVEKVYVGKVGSYSVRRVDDGRFKDATRAANTALEESKKRG